jgi:hypothetical protein
MQVAPMSPEQNMVYQRLLNQQLSALRKLAKEAV